MSEETPTFEKQPRDISTEFSTMDTFTFLEFLRTLKNEPLLSITIDWKDVWTARRLKAFLDERSGHNGQQKRTAVIRATRDQMKQEANVFSSGVKWIEV